MKTQFWKNSKSNYFSVKLVKILLQFLFKLLLENERMSQQNLFGLVDAETHSLSDGHAVQVHLKCQRKMTCWISEIPFPAILSSKTSNCLKIIILCEVFKENLKHKIFIIWKSQIKKEYYAMFYSYHYIGWNFIKSNGFVF